jgi:hypothetical protein
MKRVIPWILLLAACGPSREGPREPDAPAPGDIQIVSRGEAIEVSKLLVPGRVVVLEYFAES